MKTTPTMCRIRVRASRCLWLLERDSARYRRVVAYECRRNGTETYTPYWAV
jgi:hypothetical protein